MSASYFKLWYRLASQDAYLIWVSNSEDRVFVDPSGHVPVFLSIDALRGYASLVGISLVEEEPLLHNLDEIAAWLSASEAQSIDCDNLLAAWNLFADVAASIGKDFDSDRLITNPIYKKLFYGGETANKVLRPKTEPKFKPAWSSGDVEIMRVMLGTGLSMFKQAICRMA